MSKHNKAGQAKLKAIKEEESKKVSNVANEALKLRHEFDLAIHLHQLRVESFNGAIQIMKEDDQNWTFEEVTGEADKIFEYFQKDAKISNTDKK